MKYVVVVIDGGGDAGTRTPLSLAKKPNTDFLAKRGVVGLLDMKYKGGADSDIGYLKLLGCYSEREYPGRGYLEAIGLGLEPGEGDVCIRGNFATLDSAGNIADRRAGREEEGLERLCRKLDGMEIDGVRFVVRKSAGHRVVIMMKGERLSDRIVPNDPRRTGVPLPQVQARDINGRFTASVLNKFVYRATKILSEQPVNRKRRFPANTILIRSVGMKKSVRSFRERFGLSGACISAMPVAFGVASFLGLEKIRVRGATGYVDTDLDAKAGALLKALKKHDFVFLHINGADIASHNRQPDVKRRFIEKIDRKVIRVVRSLDDREHVVAVTCDHRTASSPSFRGYEHLTDPVPLLVSGGKTIPDRIERFDEAHAERGSFRIEGNDLVRFMMAKSGI